MAEAGKVSQVKSPLVIGRGWTGVNEYLDCVKVRLVVIGRRGDWTKMRPGVIRRTCEWAKISQVRYIHLTPAQVRCACYN